MVAIPIHIAEHTADKRKPRPVLRHDICPKSKDTNIMKSCAKCPSFKGFIDWENVRCLAA